MNLSFDNTQNAFAYKSTADLKKAKFLISTIQSPICHIEEDPEDE
jgi:proline dehydrogenase